MMINKPHIKISDIGFAYDPSEVVLDGVSFSLAAGEVMAVVAPVGGGKSTLLKVCAGLVQPTSGDVLIDNMHVWNLSDVERGNLRRRMGFVFQEAALIANMSIFNNLALPLSYHDVMPVDDIEGAIVGWLKKLDLNEYRNDLPAALSLGLRRRVSFARAMLIGSDYFFWDDPTAGVADDFSEVIRDAVIEQKGRGAVQMIVTQDKALMHAVADKALVIEDGTVTYCGAISGIRDRD
jgi:phospholipid/cholesterol/gamma-HCH transport system ATP-binding protein